VRLARAALESARVQTDTLEHPVSEDRSGEITLFVCGDVMTGRGIDQILPHPADPRLNEPFVRSALGYVELAERESGTIPRPVGFDYIWGDALAELDRVNPDLRLLNLETAVTKSGDILSWKGINYRMHPENIPCLQAAGIDGCALANNHVLDWGEGGLLETVETLERAGIRAIGAGRDAGLAARPATFDFGERGRVIVHAIGVASSGIPSQWGAAARRPGVNFIADLSPRSVATISRQIARHRRPADLVVVSIHWGGNWGFPISREERDFAHALIDDVGVNLVHGHSSHHVKGIEVHRGRLILYGCGDFLNDYEGIGGHEEFRGDLALMYFPRFDPASGRLTRLDMTPTRTRRLRVNRADEAATGWLLRTLNREGERFGSRFSHAADGRLRLQR